MSQFIQAKCCTTGERAECVTEVFESFGALSVTRMDAKDTPILEPTPGTTSPSWPDVKLLALFPTASLTDGLKARLNEALSSHLIGAVSFTNLPERDWTRAWMDDFKPMCFGERTWIVPHESDFVPPPGSAVIHLDPGLAFGTGTHATTHLCLEYLDRALQPDQKVLDFGCGSGVLSLAALKLGAEHVTAVDIDPQALLATRDNADRNRISDDRLTIRPPEALAPNADFDYVVANILITPLLELKGELYRRCAPNGRLVVSGILETQVDTLMTAYESHFTLETCRLREEWALISFRPLSEPR